MNTSATWKIKDPHRLLHWSSCTDLAWALAYVPSITVLQSLYEGLRA